MNDIVTGDLLACDGALIDLDYPSFLRAKIGFYQEGNPCFIVKNDSYQDK